MIQLNLRQWQYESDGWKRQLEFNECETGYLLERLSQAIRESGDENFLANAERFQSRFVDLHQGMRALKAQVAAFDHILVEELYLDGEPVNGTVKIFHNLKNRVAAEEREFRKLKAEFDQYISSA